MYALIFQTTYDTIQCGLATKGNIVDLVSFTKFKGSELLMTSCLALLKKHKIDWSSLSYIAANQGPGPFTSLRIIIATVNGISFSLGTPLIGIDGLYALIKETEQAVSCHKVIVALLNAFNFDLYVGVSHNNEYYATWNNHAEAFNNLAKQFSGQPITFVGNGAQIYEKEICALFGNNAQIIKNDTCSLHSIAQQADHQWIKSRLGKKELQPLYLKTQKF